MAFLVNVKTQQSQTPVIKKRAGRENNFRLITIKNSAKSQLKTNLQGAAGRRGEWVNPFLIYSLSIKSLPATHFVFIPLGKISFTGV